MLINKFNSINSSKVHSRVCSSGKGRKNTFFIYKYYSLQITEGTKMLQHFSRLATSVQLHFCLYKQEDYQQTHNSKR